VHAGRFGPGPRLGAAPRLFLRHQRVEGGEQGVRSRWTGVALVALKDPAVILKRVLSSLRIISAQASAQFLEEALDFDDGLERFFTLASNRRASSSRRARSGVTATSPPAS